jgi:hypothetical protein
VFHKVMTNCQGIFRRDLALGLVAVGTRLVGIETCVS